MYKIYPCYIAKIITNSTQECATANETDEFIDKNPIPITLKYFAISTYFNPKLPNRHIQHNRTPIVTTSITTSDYEETVFYATRNKINLYDSVIKYSHGVETFFTHDYSLPIKSTIKRGAYDYIYKQIALEKGFYDNETTWTVKTVQDVFSQIGGLTNFIIGFFSFVLIFFQTFSLDTVLINLNYLQEQTLHREVDDQIRTRAEEFIEKL